ncbi:MAG: outer membrane lipid asymmetry maintenance protein MlaD [Gammaproteobacteria bacterium]|nr:outer membrane lipid asymmetry maintenance protein MlaD [Gammaproteobacteria bacterium]
MDQKRMEIFVGGFVAAGIAALVVLALQVSNLAGYDEGDTYDIEAHFENIGGLKVRAPVMLAGVRVGTVASVSLDTQTFEAVVTLAIDDKYKVLPIDTSASIFTAGLLGEQYVALEPGGDEKLLNDGDKVKLTQSAIVLEQVIGQVLFSKAAGNE